MLSLRNLIPSVLRDRMPVAEPQRLAEAVRVYDENPAVQQAREDFLRTIVEQWLGSKPDAKDEREGLYMQAHALSQMDANMRVYLAQNAMKDKKHAG